MPRQADKATHFILHHSTFTLLPLINPIDSLKPCRRVKRRTGVVAAGGNDVGDRGAKRLQQPLPMRRKNLRPWRPASPKTPRALPLPPRKKLAVTTSTNSTNSEVRSIPNLVDRNRNVTIALLPMIPRVFFASKSDGVTSRALNE
mgnify:CR=1 FL=1